MRSTGQFRVIREVRHMPYCAPSRYPASVSGRSASAPRRGCHSSSDVRFIMHQLAAGGGRVAVAASVCECSAHNLMQSWLHSWQQVPEDTLRHLCVPGFVFGKGRDTLEVLKNELGQSCSLDVLQILAKALSRAVPSCDDRPPMASSPSDLLLPWQQGPPCLDVATKVLTKVTHYKTGVVTGSIRSLLGGKYPQLVLRTRVDRTGRFFSCARLQCLLFHGYPFNPWSIVHHKCENKACVQPHHLVWCTRRENDTNPGHLVVARQRRANQQPRRAGRFVAAAPAAAGAAATAATVDAPTPKRRKRACSPLLRQAETAARAVQHVLSVHMPRVQARLAAASVQQVRPGLFLFFCVASLSDA